MSLNTYNAQTQSLTNIASGSRTWIGTKAEHDAARQAGTLPLNAMICITDDEDDIQLQNEINDVVNVYGAKNFLRHNITDKTEEGVTYTVNSDRSITISGTPTGYTGIVLRGFTLPKGKYILSGCEDVANYQWDAVRLFKNSTEVAAISIATKHDKEFDTSAYDYDAVEIGAKRANNNILISGTLYPMVRCASIYDDTYEPFSMTNQDLTNNTIKNIIVTDRFFISGVTLTAYTRSSELTGTIANISEKPDIVILLPADSLLSCSQPSSWTYSGTTITVKFTASTSYSGSGGYVNPNFHAVLIYK